MIELDSLKQNLDKIEDQQRRTFETGTPSFSPIVSLYSGVVLIAVLLRAWMSRGRCKWHGLICKLVWCRAIPPMEALLASTMDNWPDDTEDEILAANIRKGEQAIGRPSFLTSWFGFCSCLARSAKDSGSISPTESYAEQPQIPKCIPCQLTSTSFSARGG